MKRRNHTRLVVLGFVGFLSLPWGGLGARSFLPQGSSTPLTPSPGQTAEISPRRTEVSLEQRGDIFMARKAYTDAVDYYHRALKQSNFKSASLWNKLGIAYQQQFHYRAADKAYKRATRQQEDFAEPWNNLGTIYFMQNKFRKSVTYYQHAIKLNPNAASFHLNLGTSFYRLKKYKEAVEEYRAALSLDPNVLAERSQTGTVLQTRGADPEYYFYMAKVFASLGRPEEAVRYLRRSFEDGFKDFKRVEEDPDFTKINQHPAFIELMNNRPVPIKD